MDKDNARVFIFGKFDNPPMVDPLLISSVGLIANAYSKHKWNVTLPESTVKTVLEAFIMYRQLLDLGKEEKDEA